MKYAKTATEDSGWMTYQDFLSNATEKTKIPAHKKPGFKQKLNIQQLHYSPVAVDENNFLQPLTLKEKIRDLAKECATQLECEILDIKVINRIELIQIYIGKLDNTPMDMELCAKLNYEICTVLEVYLPNVRLKYGVEVISAGLDRVLMQTRDYIHNIGKRVSASYMNNNQQYHQMCFLMHADENEIWLLSELILSKICVDKQFGKQLAKIVHADSDTISHKMTQESIVCDLLSCFKQTDVAFSNILQQSNFLLIKNSIFPLKYDTLLKVRLAPLFE